MVAQSNHKTGEQKQQHPHPTIHGNEQAKPGHLDSAQLFHLNPVFRLPGSPQIFFSVSYKISFKNFLLFAYDILISNITFAKRFPSHSPPSRTASDVTVSP